MDLQRCNGLVRTKHREEEALDEELEESCGVDLLDLEMTNDLLKTMKYARRKKQFEKKQEKLRRGLHIEDRATVIPLQQKPWELGDKGQIDVTVFTPENEVPVAHDRSTTDSLLTQFLSVGAVPM